MFKFCEKKKSIFFITDEFSINYNILKVQHNFFNLKKKSR